METFLKDLRDFLKQSSCIADYFLTIGVSLDNLKSHLENNIQLTPMILSQFPPIQKLQVEIPQSLPIVKLT